MRRRRCLASLVAGLLLYATHAYAQSPLPLPATVPLQFESWQAASSVPERNGLKLERLIGAEKNRKRQALIGGAIGAVVGFAFCTMISTLSDDPSDSVSFCSLDATLLMVGGGFAVGAAIGWAI